ncbi:MAG: hypothetical protein ACI8PB_000246 [Desulforhopalus sp.]|jgi:hypothetical protein
MNKYIKDAYFLFVLLFSGFSITFFRSAEGLIALWALGLLIFWKSLLRPLSMPLFIALAVWMSYFGLSTVLIGSFHPFFMATYIAKIMIAWWLLSYYRERIFIKYEDVIYYLAIISLVFYAWQVINPGSLFILLDTLDLSQDLFPHREYASIGIYTFHQGYWFDFFPRNAGFSWEPGPFSCYIVLAMFFNLARNKVQIRDTKRMSVFLLAIITTQSTTGVLAIFPLVLWYVWVHFKNSYLLICSMSIVFGLSFLLFTNVPYLQEKIISESEQNVEKVILNSIRYKRSYAPGRFASLQLGLIDLKNYPIAGIGGNTSLRYATRRGAEVATINGFANIMTRYGFIGVSLFLYLIFTSGKWMTRYFRVSGYLIFPALILTISFSFGIIESPIIVTLWLIPVFLKNTIYREKEHA